MTSRRTATLPAVVLLVAALLLAACGSNDSGPDHGAADVTFATAMAQHHQQALQMVNLTEGRTLDPAFQTLATRIDQEQLPEIETMKGWLQQWGEPVPSAQNAMGTMGNMGAAPMPGMMTGTQMSRLANASDATFEPMWLRLMIRHHQGAVTMSKDEIDHGQYADAVALARSITATQTAEIVEMQKLLAGLPQASSR